MRTRWACLPASSWAGLPEQGREEGEAQPWSAPEDRVEVCWAPCTWYLFPRLPTMLALLPGKDELGAASGEVFLEDPCGLSSRDALTSVES